jgi:hypothetical protein
MSNTWFAGRGLLLTRLINETESTWTDLLHPDSLKNPKPNSDGLIKCLPPTQDSFVTGPKIYSSNICSIYKILWHPDCFVSRDSIFGLAG